MRPGRTEAQLGNHLAHRMALGIASQQVAPMVASRAIVGEDDVAAAVLAFSYELFTIEP